MLSSDPQHSPHLLQAAHQGLQGWRERKLCSAVCADLLIDESISWADLFVGWNAETDDINFTQCVFN
jgi:hypothetical protein